jgi:hypothetical protein
MSNTVSLHVDDDDDDSDDHHHHLAVKDSGHLLVHSGLSLPKVTLKVIPDDGGSKDL